jgi:hypothetical protein
VTDEEHAGSDSLRLCLQRILRLFDEAGLKGMVIDGIAAATLGRARFTHDVDLTSTLDGDDLESFVALAERAGFATVTPGELARARWQRLLQLDDQVTGIQLTSPSPRSHSNSMPSNTRCASITAG